MSTIARPFFIMLGLLLGATLACSFGATGPGSTPASNNGGKNSAPTFAAGAWTGGKAEVRVSGSDARTITGALITESSTDGGTTRLIYADGIDTISISISTEYEPFGITASQDDFDIEIRYGQPPCDVTYQETSDKRIEGTFRCEHAEIMIGPKKGPAVMEGSFTATR